MQTREIHNSNSDASSDTPTLRDHYATTYVVVRNSCLNSLKYFHVVDGMSPNIMHDMLQRVLHGCANLKDLIIKKSLLWIQQLNDIIEAFCYGPIETSNKPSLIKEKGFSDTNDIKQSGKNTSHMMN